MLPVASPATVRRLRQYGDVSVLPKVECGRFRRCHRMASRVDGAASVRLLYANPRSDRESVVDVDRVPRRRTERYDSCTEPRRPVGCRLDAFPSAEHCEIIADNSLSLVVLILPR